MKIIYFEGNISFLGFLLDIFLKYQYLLVIFKKFSFGFEKY